MASISYTRISEFAKAIGLASACDFNGFVGYVTATAEWGRLRKEGSNWTLSHWTLSQEYDLVCSHVDIITPDNIDNLELFYSAPGGIII